MEKYNENRINSGVAKILTDETSTAQTLDAFFEIVTEPLSVETQKYADSCGKNIKELNDSEIKVIVDQIADTFLGQMMNLLMQSQSLPELMEIVKKNGTHDDFSESTANNYDRKNFIRQWDHSDTKLGSPMSLEQLKEDAESFECTRNFFDEGATLHEVNELEQDFLKTLNQDEKRLYFLRKERKTQKEIAEILYIQQGSVSKRIAKLKDKFKAFIR